MTRETENTAFLNRIIEAPDDDTVRLVYADWLDENGAPERAAFIRLQIESERAEPVTDNPAREHASRLLDQYGEQWAAEVGFRAPGVSSVYFRRGFIESVRAFAAVFVRHGAGWVHRAPVRGLRLTHVAGGSSRLGACRHLQRITELQLCDPSLGTRDLRELITSQNLRLRSLQIQGGSGEDVWRRQACQVGTDGLGGLAEAPFLAQLERLRICTRAVVGGRGLRALAESKNIGSLRSFELTGGDVADAGALVLANSTRLGGLESLTLESNSLSGTGMVALLHSPGLRGLVDVDLSYNWGFDFTIRGLSGLNLPPRLELIRMGGSPISSPTALHLIQLMRANPRLVIDLNKWDVPKELREQLEEVYSTKHWPTRGFDPCLVCGVTYLD